MKWYAAQLPARTSLVGSLIIFGREISCSPMVALVVSRFIRLMYGFLDGLVGCLVSGEGWSSFGCFGRSRLSESWPSPGLLPGFLCYWGVDSACSK